MIQSAVVVPEPEEQHQEPTLSLKRRQSSISSETSSKRPRLSPRSSVDHGSSKNISPPPQRKPSQANTSTGAQERQRTQRLFGNVFSNLNKTSAKPAHRKRDEIEKRQQERLKLQTEEAAEEKRKRREEVDVLRQKQQKTWDEQSIAQRHRNMKATAHFLQTKTKPQLYYKPWELREDEEEQIKRQIEQVDATIKAELANDNVTSAADTEMIEVHPPVSEALSSNTEAEPQLQKSNGDMELVGADEKKSDTDKQGDSNMAITSTTAITDETTVVCDTSKEKDRPKTPDAKPHDEHGGEELVEGQEDDVIY